MKIDIEKLFDELSHISQVEAIALGGSRATGRNDEKSNSVYPIRHAMSMAKPQMFRQPPRLSFPF